MCSTLKRLFVHRRVTVNNAPHRTIIRANQPWWRIEWRAIIEYRDLLWLLVRRDFVAIYKQTILGPLWFIIQPLATTLVFTVIFGGLANMPTDGVPKFIFFMSGTVLWGFFQGCIDGVSQSLVNNAGMFSKVYFPRLIPPLAVVFNNLIRFALTFGIFLVFWVYFSFSSGSAIQPNAWILALPLLVLECAALGLGAGLWLAALTAKYRDLRFALSFLLQVWMYLTPVVYPLSLVPPHFRWIACLNPMSVVMEIERYAFFGVGVVEVNLLMAGFAITAVVLVTGIFFYNRIQRTYIDTV